MNNHEIDRQLTEPEPAYEAKKDRKDKSLKQLLALSGVGLFVVSNVWLAASWKTGQELQAAQTTSDLKDEKSDVEALKHEANDLKYRADMLDQENLNHKNLEKDFLENKKATEAHLASMDSSLVRIAQRLDDMEKYRVGK
jgi:small-conductance mechanosensitive channel